MTRAIQPVRRSDAHCRLRRQRSRQPPEQHLNPTRTLSLLTLARQSMAVPRCRYPFRCTSLELPQLVSSPCRAATDALPPSPRSPVHKAASRHLSAAAQSRLQQQQHRPRQTQQRCLSPAPPPPPRSCSSCFHPLPLKLPLRAARALTVRRFHQLHQQQRFPVRPPQLPVHFKLASPAPTPRPRTLRRRARVRVRARRPRQVRSRTCRGRARAATTSSIRANSTNRTCSRLRARRARPRCPLRVRV